MDAARLRRRISIFQFILFELVWQVDAPTEEIMG